MIKSKSTDHCGSYLCLKSTNTAEAYYIDANTGLILNPKEESHLNNKKGYIDQTQLNQIGNKLKFPTEARDDNELNRTQKILDPFIGDLNIEYEYILDLLSNGISKNAVLTFKHLAENLSARNNYFGFITEIKEKLNMPLRTLERAIKELHTAKLIRTENNGYSWPTKISLHPWYAWSGGNTFRSNALKQWIGPPKLAGKSA